MTKGQCLVAAVFGAIAVATSAQAQADPVCERVSAFVGEAERWTPGSADVAIHLPSIFLAEGQCGSSLSMSGHHSLHCGWAFPYRATAATLAFEKLAVRIETCEGARQLKNAGNGVNHPDTFDQRRIRFAGGTVSVSLKDKVALQETYILLRVQARP